MASENCLITTPKIQELATKLSEPVASIKTLISRWQKENNKNIDDYPTAKELSIFRGKIRGTTSSITEPLPLPQTQLTVTESTVKGYPARTAANAKWSDITLSFATDFTTVGETLTAQQAGSKDSKFLGRKKPLQGAADKYSPVQLFKGTPENKNAFTLDYSDLDAAVEKAKSIGRPIKLNIAGNGIYTLQGNQEEVNQVIYQAIKYLQEQGVQIAEIRSGGQTGVDEAGIVAAMRLNIPASIHAPKGFAFRDISGVDIFDRDKFMARFAQFENEAAPLQGSALDQNQSSPFETPKITIKNQRKALNLVMDPTVRRDRVSLISRMFSEELTTAHEEMLQALQDRIESTSNAGIRMELEEELKSLTRYEALKRITPKGIFDRVKKHFEDYVNDTEEAIIAAEFNTIRNDELDRVAEGLISESDMYTDEEILESVRKKVPYKVAEYTKVIDNFEELAKEATSSLAVTENIRFDLDSIAPEQTRNLDDTEDTEDAEDSNPQEEEMDDAKKEETVKDGWMIHFREVSSHSSLSQAVRAALREIPRLDRDGNYALDDLGNIRYLDPEYAHAVLIDGLQNMIDVEDMMPLLEKLSETKPWVAQVIETLKEDEALYSQFYQGYSKYATTYSIQIVKSRYDGSYSVETKIINRPEGVQYLTETWRDNYESGAKLDKDSVYKENREIDASKGSLGLGIVNELTNLFASLTQEDTIKELDKSQTWDKVMKVLHMIGIDMNPDVVRRALVETPEIEGVSFTPPIRTLLHDLNIIFTGISKGELATKTDKDGRVQIPDLINHFGSAFNNIAVRFAEVNEDVIESSSREGGKSYYAHVNSSFLGNTIKKLKNVMKNQEKFQKFIDTYRNNDWFFKDGMWFNDWLEKIVSDPKARENLKHKVLLNYDKIEYSDWDSLDYTLILLNEYWSEDKSGYTWYPVFIMADKPSAEFVRFVRYKNGSQFDSEGREMSYQDIIAEKMATTVLQEYNRIQKVRRRALDESIKKIAYYDMTDRSVGGAEFKFFPWLNSLSFDNGLSFEQKIRELQGAGDGTALRSFIVQVLKENMEKQFEAAYKHWDSIGLFEENSSGRYSVLPGNRLGQSTYNKNLYNVLTQAKELLKSAWTTKHEVLLRSLANNKVVEDVATNNTLQEIKELVLERQEAGEIAKKDADAMVRRMVYNNPTKEALREYYWNSAHATSQLIEIDSVDLAFFGDVKNFQKRHAAAHSPYLKLNTKATFRGERVGRDYERTVFVADDVIKSPSLKDIEEVLDAKVADGSLSAASKAYILKQFSKVNWADGQAYRSMSSYRAILAMSGEWTDAMEEALNRIKAGKWNIEDFSIIWQVKKPRVYTHATVPSGLEGYSDITVPQFHKNSEFPLLAMYSMIAGPLANSKLAALNEWMEANNIDVVQFESAVKVGGQGVIDINNSAVKAWQAKAGREGKTLTENQAVQEMLTEFSGIKDLGVGGSSEVIHSISYEDYGIQTATPEHFIDAVQLFGTQLRKLITADMADDAVLEIAGKKMTKKQWLQYYQDITTENILDAFKEINKIFEDPKMVEKILLDEVRGNPRYTRDMQEALTLDENGRFNIPLFDPVISEKVQQLLNSIIKGGYGGKSGITRQKIKGGACIQVSSWGLSDDLHIVFEGSGKTKRVKYLECYLPAYSTKFFEPLLSTDAKGNKFLDPDKLDDDLRKLIGYRIPTEGLYSMAPLYIKGFLPAQNGSSIMLPAEITTMSGSDFDVDKLYIFAPEFRVERYDRKKAEYYYNKENAGLQSLKNNVEEVLEEEGVIDEDFSELTKNPKLDKWARESIANGDPYELAYETPIIKKIRYNYSKEAKDNSREARNNALIDLIFGALTSADAAPRLLNPGGFDPQIRSARLSDILTHFKEKDLRKVLIDGGYQIKTATKGGRVVELPLYETLKTVPVSMSSATKEQNKKLGKPSIDLEDIVGMVDSSMDVLSPTTQVELHQRNMTGANLIRIYAVHNAHNALLQHANVQVNSNGEFTLDGQTLTSLSSLRSYSGEFISKLTAGYLAASVDNAKNPVLASLNQNMFTAEVTMFLTRLGYDSDVVGLLMNQPIIKDMTTAYFRESRTGTSKFDIMDKVLKKYQLKASIGADITYDSIKNKQFLASELADNIMVGNEITEGLDFLHSSDSRIVDFYRNQVAVGSLFTRIMKTSDSLSSVVRAMRADTPSGAAGPTIAATILKMHNVSQIFEDVTTNEKYPLSGVLDLFSFDAPAGASVDALRDYFKKSKLPFMAAFAVLGVNKTQNMLQRYFPHYSDSFQKILFGSPEEGVSGILDYTKSGRLDERSINSVFNELFAYILSKTEFFGGDQNHTSLEKRAAFIKGFPDYFQRLIAKPENAQIADLELIKRLKRKIKNEHNPLDVIDFKNVGRLTTPLKERFSADWESLLYMDNPDAVELALNLFRYCFFRNGLSFGPYTFAHLAPLAVRLAVPGYKETLEAFIPREDGSLSVEDDLTLFIEQYIMNHLDNRRFAPEIGEDSKVSFLDEEKNVKDEILFFTPDEFSYLSKDDNKFIKEKLVIDGQPVYTFRQFIARKEKGRMFYYRLTSSDGRVATYNRVNPLGVKNNFLEYEYGRPASEMSSAIPDNTSSSSTIEDASRYMSPELVEEAPERTYDLSDEYYASLRKSVEAAYTPPQEVPSSTLDAYTPENNYKDETGQTICPGAPTIAKL